MFSLVFVWEAGATTGLIFIWWPKNSCLLILCFNISFSLKQYPQVLSEMLSLLEPTCTNIRINWSQNQNYTQVLKWKNLFMENTTVSPLSKHLFGLNILVLSCFSKKQQIWSRYLHQSVYLCRPSCTLTHSKTDIKPFDINVSTKSEWDGSWDQIQGKVVSVLSLHTATLSLCCHKMTTRTKEISTQWL